MVSADSGMLDVLTGHCSGFCSLTMLCCAEDQRMSGPTKSLSSLDFGEMVLASSFVLRQERPKTKQIWGYLVCAEVCAITAVLQIVLRYSLKRLLRNVYSHYTQSSVNTPLKQM